MCIYIDDKACYLNINFESKSIRSKNIIRTWYCQMKGYYFSIPYLREGMVNLINSAFHLAPHLKLTPII